jgi:Zn-dependent protease with chaperone function
MKTSEFDRILLRIYINFLFIILFIGILELFLIPFFLGFTFGTLNYWINLSEKNSKIGAVILIIIINIIIGYYSLRFSLKNKYKIIKV